MTIFHAFVVRNVPPRMNDRQLSPPDNLGDSQDGPVDIGLWIPIARNQEHVAADMNPRLMNVERSCRSGVMTLQIDVSKVRRGFVWWDVDVEVNNPSAGPQRAKVVTLHNLPGLVLCVSLATVKGDG